MADNFINVLCLPSLVASITAFQDGLDSALLPLLQLSPPEAPAAIDEIFRPWLARHGTSRLTSITSPRILSLLLTYAAYTDNPGIVAHVHSRQLPLRPSLPCCNAWWPPMVPHQSDAPWQPPIQLMQPDKDDPAKQLFAAAATYGSIRLVQWLATYFSRALTWTGLNQAIYAGHLAVVEFVASHHPDAITANVLDTALFYGHDDIVNFVQTVRPGLFDETGSAYTPKSFIFRPELGYWTLPTGKRI
ncbi:Aste57867_22464 [Aphanomyces stellatus]|uniref:Aste57867_22464 protein n=1 Tax=Aphanomyces stellatus TaxID=120398 RepID=A0A485LK53_9STRA|nr:hypothetical protein As57867_022394 [Aphanomyces stellatus]VFT99124.1 Aste57867_22464 [Aphanomyces stellatus]